MSWDEANLLDFDMAMIVLRPWLLQSDGFPRLGVRS